MDHFAQADLPWIGAAGYLDSLRLRAFGAPGPEAFYRKPALHKSLLHKPMILNALSRVLLPHPGRNVITATFHIS
jgi:hypothetical protein